MINQKALWVLLALIFATGNLLAQPRYELCIRAETNVGNTLVFDVYMKNTGTAPLNLATSDFVFQYNLNYFCDTVVPEIKLDNKLRLLGYDVAITDLSGITKNAFGFAFEAPLVEDDVVNIGDRILQIAPDQEDRLFQVVLSTVCEPNLDNNVRFGNARNFKTTVFSYPESAPFSRREFNIDQGSTICSGDNSGGGPGVVVESNITVYPNPVRDVYNLIIKDHPFQKFKIEVVDVSGRVVQRYDRESNGLSEVNELIMPNEIPAGAYVVNVSDQRDVLIGSATFMVTK